MKNLINIIILVLSMNLAYAQENYQVVKKKVLFIRHYVGKHGFPKPNPNGERLKTGNLQLDMRVSLMLPYDMQPDGLYLPFREYLIVMARRPFIYLFNDFFYTINTFDYEYKSLIKDGEIDPINLFEALPENKTFITEIDEDVLAKIWIIEAEWVQIPFKEKTTSTAIERINGRTNK